MDNQKTSTVGFTRRWILVLSCVALCLVLAVVGSLRRPEPARPPIVLLPRDYANPAQYIPLFNRLVPPTKSWAWLWHVKEKLLGKVRPVAIQADVITLPNVSPIPLAVPDLQTGESSESPGVQIWMLPQAELTSLRQQLKQMAGADLVNSPRVTIGDGTDASLFVGDSIIVGSATNDIGLRLSCRARIHGEVTDFTTFVAYLTTSTNPPGSSANLSQVISVHTNLDVKARFQIPKGKGIFLLQSSTHSNGPSPIGVILSIKL